MKVSPSSSSSSSPSTSSFEMVSSFDSNEILDRYDGFLVDQWGVMHNGMEAMKHAPECIAKLAAKNNKKLVILSNSPSSEDETLQALIKLGFDPHHFQGGAVTSGMLASAYIQQHYSNKKALLMAWKSPAAPSIHAFLERCGTIDLVDSFDDRPDVLIVQGNQILLGPMVGNDNENSLTRRRETSLGDFVISGNTHEVIDPILQQCASRQIPLICVDPDFVTVNPDKSVLYMPGTIAKRYEEHFGGTSIYFGKPYAPGFEEGIQRLLQLGIKDKSRIAMIGDSLHHDVTGANAVGIDSILVLGGVHRRDLGNLDLGEMPPAEKLEALFAKDQQRPTIVTPLLKSSSNDDDGNNCFTCRIM